MTDPADQPTGPPVRKRRITPDLVAGLVALQAVIGMLVAWRTGSETFFVVETLVLFAALCWFGF